MDTTKPDLSYWENLKKTYKLTRHQRKIIDLLMERSRGRYLARHPSDSWPSAKDIDLIARKPKGGSKKIREELATLIEYSLCKPDWAAYEYGYQTIRALSRSLRIEKAAKTIVDGLSIIPAFVFIMGLSLALLINTISLVLATALVALIRLPLPGRFGGFTVSVMVIELKDNIIRLNEQFREWTG